MFGTARLYAGAGLVADVLARHPGVRVELIGQNSTDVPGGPAPRPDRGGDDRRADRSSSEGMQVTPVARDELVYISADPERLQTPVTAHRLARGVAW